MRRPVISTPRLAVDFLESMAAARGATFDIELNYPEGEMVGAGEPILYITGSLYHLVDLETLYAAKARPGLRRRLQRLRRCAPSCPRSRSSRWTRGIAPAPRWPSMMAYAASVGSAAAQRKVAGAIGFVGCATDATAHYFGKDKGIGTMPHALIGYAGSTVRAAEMFRATFPDEPLTVLVDYFGREITDAVAVVPALPRSGGGGRARLRMRHAWRPLLRGARPRPLLRGARARSAPQSIRGYRTEDELRYLVGTGVSAAALWHLRRCSTRPAFPRSRSSPARASARRNAG